MTGASKNTIAKLLVELGAACAEYLDTHLVNLNSKRIQYDEIWQFVGAKEKNVPPAKRDKLGIGDVWTWVAIDADSKLICSWLVGNGIADEGEKRYSPAVCISCEPHPISGNPDPKHISTSYIERQNLTMRMSMRRMRRFTRLTNAFSKKLENHVEAIAIHCMHYNFVRIHQTLRITPAMAAGVTDRLWSIEDLINLL